MKHRILATAIALLFGLSLPRGAAAQAHGGGRTGAGQTAGGNSGSGHSTGGRAGKGGGVRGPSRRQDGRAVVRGGTAAPRSSGPRAAFVVTPSIYAPHFSRPHSTGLGFGIRHLGYGFGPAYYGLGYDSPLLCETTVDCDVVPATGADDVPQYEAAPPEDGSGSVRLDVQPAFAQIFVDGEYVGTVEDHAATGLMIAAGVHRVEFRSPGYEPLVVEVRIAAGRRITYRGVLKPPSP